MEEVQRREELPGEEIDMAPIYIGSDGAETGEATPAELEILTAEVVDAGDPRSGGELVLTAPLPRDLHPVLVYLVSLSEGSRRTMHASLENIARFISAGEADALCLAWHELRYQHTTLIRSTVADTYKPAMANKMLSALRGVLKECFRLGYMTAEDYQRARDLSTVKGYSLSHRDARFPRASSGGSSRFAPRVTKRTGARGTPPWLRFCTGAG